MYLYFPMLEAGGFKEMSPIFADQLRPRIWAQMRGGDCEVSASEYSCQHGAQRNFIDLTVYLTFTPVANLPSVSLILVAICHRRHWNRWQICGQFRWHRWQICGRNRWHRWQICHRYQQHMRNWWKNLPPVSVIPVVHLYLTLFYTRGLGIAVLHVMVPQPYRFSLWFFT